MSHRPRPTSPRAPGLVLACFLLTAFSPRSALAGDTYLEVRSAADLVSRWDQNQHVYVKGDIGVPAAKLAELEKWLDANAPNWTIVLMRDAGGESYHETSGRRFAGMDAVEFQLGQQLPTATGFGKLTNPQTGERNGAFFVLFLKERKFSYFASDAYDERRLGESHWIGNLDRPAIKAMRGGGRIVDAAKDTVESIDSLLARRIQAEADAEKRAKESARESLEGAESLITYSQERTTELLKSGGTGDLAINPFLAGWKAQITGARDAYNRGEFRSAIETATSVERAVQKTLKALDEHREAPQQFERIQKRIDSFVPHPQSDRAAALFNRAKLTLQAAKGAHRSADSSFAAHLAEAEVALKNAALENGAREAQIREEIRAAEARRKWTLALATVGALALALFLWALNRRRREWMIKAEELLANWDQNMADKRDALFALLDRTNLVVGSSGSVDDGSLEGETLRLAKETVRDVDELFIMSSSVDRIIDQAEALAKPGDPLRSLSNLFFASRYKKAIRLLADEPVEFSPDEPLRLIIRGREERGDAEKLLGSVADYAPFSLTFTDLVGEFDRRADRALVAVDLLETSWEEITGALETLDKSSDQLVEAESEIVAASREDGFFALPGLHDTLLPAVEEGEAGAAAVGRKDPVAAMRTWIPATRGQIEDGLSLCHTVRDARSDLFPKLETASDALRKLGRLAHWIEDTLNSLSEHADALAIKAADESVFEEAQTFAGDVRRLGEHAESAVILAKRADGPATSAINESQKNVDSARRRLARKLGIPVGSLLSEDADVDPSRRLDEANIQVVAAQAAIDRGGVLAAEASLDEADRLVVESRELIRITEEAFAAHPKNLSHQRSENARLTSLAEERKLILDRLKASYAASALCFEAGYEDAGETIALHDSNVADAISEARHAMARSEKAHATGRILEGAAELERASNEHAAARELLDEIRDHAERIASVEKQNRRDVGSLQKRADATRTTVEDPKVMIPTRKNFVNALDSLKRATEAVEAPHGQSDPFAAAAIIVDTRTRLDEVDASVRDDRRSHAEAERSLTDAAAQLDHARSLVHQADTDKIPDSRAITEAGEAVRQLLYQYETTARRIEVPHGDWPDLQKTADQIGSAAARAAAILRSELEGARAALDAVLHATHSVQSATDWRGSYGIRISGQPGIEPLHAARDLLLTGNYQETLQLAGRAAREAESAISEAESEVAARRRAERRRAEEARRRRERQRSSSFGSSFGSSSSSRSRSSSSFGSRSSSSTSRSSFSRGSGTSRSGW